MCRLYGQISSTSRNAKDFFADGDRSLLRQSRYRPGDYQKDGWGIGYFNGGRAELVKSAKGAFDEAGRFKSLASRIRSRVVIGHLRAASNPRGLPHGRLIGVRNSQPFTDGKIIFAHNGTVNIPLEIAKFLGPYQRRIRGINDSEVYFWQFLKFFDALGDIPEALQACIREMWILWRDCRARYPGKKAPYTTLNALVSDGHSLHALCHRSAASDHRSLFNPRQPWTTMSLGRRSDRFIMASEDMDAGFWSHFHEPEIVTARPVGSRISVRRMKFKVYAQ
jgi:predicted glutamine amidotransferase